MKNKNAIPRVALVITAFIIVAAILVIGRLDSPDFNHVIPLENSQYFYPAFKAESGKIDINNATAEELTELYGVGHVRAQAIIQYRKENGGFCKAEELLCISRFPRSVYYINKDKITLGEYLNESQSS